MQSNPTEFHQLGYFVYKFQFIERQIEDLILLLAGAGWKAGRPIGQGVTSWADEEMINILLAELGFDQKLKASEVMLSRFLELREGIVGKEDEKKQFRKLADGIKKLGERRNDLVHSKYWSWLNVDGEIGLLRRNATLKPSKGKLNEVEEELLPKNFEEDFSKINSISGLLEQYRLKVIDWIYPDV